MVEIKITLDKTGWIRVFTFSLSANAICAKGVFDASAAREHLTKAWIGKKTEPGTVGILLADFEALELIERGKNVDFLTVGTFSGDETLKFVAVSRI
jgi:hypothetical protein